MTELSRPWGGTTVGDAGPYTDDDWSDLWRYLFIEDRATQGILALVLNELEVTNSASPVQVDTGAAMVDGKWYLNDAAVNVVVPTPGASTRIDRIVLRKSWSSQTVRITRIAGVEGGGAPSLVQLDGDTWDIPLAQLSITTGGAITITDQRIPIVTPLARGGVDFAVQTLTDQANIAWNMARGPIAVVTLGGNRTLDNPTNLQPGATYILIAKQDGTGSRTLAYGANYKWPGGTAPTLSTAINAIDILTFVAEDASNIYGVANLAFS